MSTSSLVPPIRAGTKVHTRAIFPYLLPKGLLSGVEVTVVRVDDDLCTVRNRHGREWIIHTLSLDPGELIWVNGRWEREHVEKPAA